MSSQQHIRCAATTMNDTHINPRSASGPAAAKRLEYGFLGGKAGGIALGPASAAVFGIPPLNRRKDAIDEVIAVRVQHRLDSLNVNEIHTMHQLGHAVSVLLTIGLRGAVPCGDATNH